MTWSMIFEHLYIVLAACLLSILIGVPLGLLAYPVSYTHLTLPTRYSV